MNELEAMEVHSSQQIIIPNKKQKCMPSRQPNNQNPDTVRSYEDSVTTPKVLEVGAGCDHGETTKNEDVATTIQPTAITKVEDDDDIENPVPTAELFDFDEECSHISAEFFPHGNWKEPMTILTKRARTCYYFYRDKETFLAAIELLCRKTCEFRSAWNETKPTWHKQWDYEVVPISELDHLDLQAANYLDTKEKNAEKKCRCCERPISAQRMTHFVVDKINKKTCVCLGCVGRTCVARHGSNKVIILQELKSLRAQQEQQNQTSEPLILPYEQRYAMPLPDLHQLSLQPHYRHDCVQHPFCQTIASLCCPNCKCYVCDVPAAASCSAWATHCFAIPGETKWDFEREKLHPEVKPDGLFDFDQEKEGLNFEQFEALQKRARLKQYHYEDEETFLAALELYRRESCELREKESFRGYGAGRVKFWEPKYGCNLHRKQVCGHHRTPCHQCGKDFYGEKYYLVDETDGFGYRSKLCMGCMGRNLCFRYGSRKATIMVELNKWREKQADKQEGEFWITCPLNLAM